MKMILSFLLLLSTTLAFGHEVKCTIKYRYVGVYFNSCPLGSLAEAIEVRIYPGPYPTVNTYVRCVQPSVDCVSSSIKPGTITKK